MSNRRDLYISCDIEADGPIPGPYSMSSLGAAVAGTFDGSVFTAADPDEQTFYRELRPISPDFVPAAAAVAGLDRERLEREGADPAAAMADFARWVEDVAAGARPVFVAYPLGFDWMFVYWYLMRFAGRSPFGHSSCLDVKTLYAVKAGVPITGTGKRSMPRHLHSRRRHTHNALDDAAEQADLFANLMRWDGTA